MERKSVRTKGNIYVVPVSLPTLFFQPYPNNLLLEVKYLKIVTFSDFGAIFFVKYFNKLIISLPTYPKLFWHEIGTTHTIYIRFGLTSLLSARYMY